MLSQKQLIALGVILAIVVCFVQSSPTPAAAEEGEEAAAPPNPAELLGIIIAQLNEALQGFMAQLASFLTPPAAQLPVVRSQTVLPKRHDIKQ